jgi:hypothetical protein
MPGPIDTYVAELARSLPGPRSVRRDLLAELDDGLRDAADAHRATGVPAREAELLAVRDTGPVADLVADYRSELAAKSGRHTAMLLAITLLSSTVAWDLIWYVVPSQGLALPGVVVLARVITWACILCVVVCGLGVGLLRLSARARLPVNLVNRMIVVVGLLAVAVIVGSSVAMNLINMEDSGQVLKSSAALTGLTLASAVAMAAALRALLSTMRTTRALER